MELNTALIFFMRYPSPGKVKTRLAAGIGDHAACELYSCFIRDILQTTDSTGLDVHIFAWPAHELDHVKNWLKKEYLLFPQNGSDLGEKMKNAFEQVFELGYSKALLTGSDIPDLPAQVILEAEQCLDTHDCVLGPSRDGGYYLVGFNKKRFCPAIFSGPQWGTHQVLEQTRAILKNNRIATALATPWRDVDEVDDLKALHARLTDNITRAEATRACLENLQVQRPNFFTRDQS
ncbi:MAG: TIGR04282 family arsenosugar biosynthesis glycosyltransferase [Desulfatibacillum sp.]|nr:TIGR04282 family arsenosugar biosynthesis glycosyltransferase [Desulfatibacillum sp.]